MLAGLGETGNSSDVPVLTQWLQHPTPRGRASAVRALRSLGAATPARVASLLEDRSAAVARQAAQALVGHSKDLDSAFLEGLIEPNRPRHVRVAGYLLLRGRDVWTRLTTDLRLVADPEPAISLRARTDLEAWLRREAATTYARPVGADKVRLGRLLDRAENSLSAGTVKQLRFHLGLQRAATS